VIRRLAEDSNAYQPLGVRDERIETDRYILWLGSRNHPAWTVAQRLRLNDENLVDTVAEIRQLVADRGRTALSWEVSGSATPADLAERLGAFGIVPDSDPHVLAMVLRREPPAGPPDVVVRRADSLEDRQVHGRIGATAFGMADADTHVSPPPSAHRACYLAVVDGEPVGAGSATFTEWGVVMNGGSTLEHARGRGAYRALVRARWDDAVVRGTPALVTQAGALSRPILERLGFEQVAEIRSFLDELG
jgi:hypothetical protein